MNCRKNVDAFFYDGDHRPEALQQASIHVWPTLKGDAIIVIDDSNHHGVLEATR